MKMMTKEIENEFVKYPLLSQICKKGDAVAVCKLFNTFTGKTYYVIEGQKNGDGVYAFTGIVKENDKLKVTITTNICMSHPHKDDILVCDPSFKSKTIKEIFPECY